MENLKLTSIRISVASLDAAHNLSRQLTYYNPSDVLRLAMWIGLKVMSPNCMSALISKMFDDEAGFDVVTLEDVLRTAGVWEKLKGSAGL